MVPNQQQDIPIPNPNPRHYEDMTIRVDIPDFDGNSHNPSHYLEWEERMDQYFEFQETPPERQFKLAKVKMTKLTSTWLEGLQRQRVREGRPGLDTWNKLKKHLRRKYVPPTYKQQLYVHISTLTQGNKSVQDYIQEWERLSVLCDVPEPEDMKVGRFIAGLREEIRRKLICTPDLTLHSVGHLALEIERNKKKGHSSHTYTKANRTYTPKTNVASCVST